MSQFTPAYRLPRPAFDIGAPAGPRVGVQTTDIAPPIVAQDPASQQLSGALDAFVRDVGIGGNIAEDATRRAEVQANKDERQKAIDENKALRIAQVSVKNGVAQAAIDIVPQEVAKIKAGQFQYLPEDKNSPERAVARIVREKRDMILSALPQDHALALYDSVDTELDRVVSRPLLDAIYAKGEVDRKVALQTSLDGLRDRLLLTTNPEELASVMADAKDGIPGATMENLNDALARAMIGFARIGQDQMLEEARKVLGENAVDKQIMAENLLAAKKQQDVRQTESDFADQIAGLRNSNTPYESVVQAIRSAKGITDSAREQQLRATDAWAHEAFKQAIAERDAQTVSAEQDRIGRLLDEGRIYAVPNKIQFMSADGSTQRSIDTSPMIEQAVQRRLSSIAQQFPNDPRAASGSQIQYLTAIDYLPSSMKTLMDVGATNAVTATLTDDNSIPENTRAAFALYKQLSAASPGLAAKVGERTKMLFDLASILQESPMVGAGTPQSDRQALLTASQSLKNGAPPLTDNDQFQMRQALNQVGSGVANAGELRRLVEQRANIYARAGGMSIAPAVAKAWDEIKATRQEINGYSVDFAPSSIPPAIKEHLPAISETVIDKWLSDNKEAAEGLGVKKDSIVLAPGRDGSVVLRDARYGLPLPGTPVISIAELGNRTSAIMNAKRQEIVSKTLAAQAGATPWLRLAKEGVIDATAAAAKIQPTYLDSLNQPMVAPNVKVVPR